MFHREIVGADAIHQFAFIQATDPALVETNYVAATKAWIDTSTTPATLRVRNDANTAWTTLGTLGGGAGGGLTEEQIRDLVAAFIVAGTNITASHDDVGDMLTIAAAGGAGAPVLIVTNDATGIGGGVSELHFPSGVVFTDDPYSTDQIATYTPPAGGGAFSGCIATVGNSSFNSGHTVIGFDGEEYDTDGYHSVITDNSRITIPAGGAGRYSFFAYARVGNIGTNERVELNLLKNGVDVVGGDSKSGSTFHNLTTSRDIALAAGDYIEARLFLTVGSGNIYSGGGNPVTVFGCHRLVG